jgi:hypothetical protein
MFKKVFKTEASSLQPVRRTATAAIEQLEDRQLMSASFKIGIGVNDASSSFMNAASGKLKGLGVQTVRLWYSTDFNSKSINGVLQRAIDYGNKGFDVMLEVAPKGGKQYSSSAITSWFNWAMGQSSLKNAVDRWEIGNEPDHSQYWQGSLSQYVNNLLKPSYNVLHAHGEQVVSAGPSWDPGDVQEMINAGMLNVTDYVGFHPYASGVSGVESSLSKIKSVVQGRKPLVASEWNVRGLEGNASAWSSAVKQVYADVANTFAINYYYAATKSSTPAGPGGIMYSDGSANTLFYNAFASFKNGGSGSASSSSSSGNTASAGTGKITGTLWNDSDGDGTWDSNETNTGSRTVFIDSNGNGKLDSGEKSTTSNSSGQYTFSGLKAGTYKISRVFPSGYHMSNSSSSYITVNLNAGQTFSNANIGTTDKSGSSYSSGSSSSTGKITGTLWNDSNGNGKWDNGEKATGSRTVFIDSNGNGKLDGGEKSTTSNSSGYYSFSGLNAGAYKVSRVFPSGYKISNSSTKDIVVSLAAGQTVANVNIGTKNS